MKPHKPKPKRAEYMALIRTLHTTQGGLCALCGEPVKLYKPGKRHEDPAKRPSLDHIKPRAKGGADSPDNLQLTHYGCNKKKGNQ